MRTRSEQRRGRPTSSIALLVGTALNPFFPFFPLGVDAFLADAVLDAPQAGTRVVTFLAGLLAVCTGVLDLAPLWADGGHQGCCGGGTKGIHVERNGGWRDGHGGEDEAGQWPQLPCFIMYYLILTHKHGQTT